MTRDRQTTTTDAEAPLGRRLYHPWLRKAALLLLLLAAILLPRLVALRGVSMSARLDFADVPLHLLNLDKLAKLHSLDGAQVDDPYFEIAPHQRKLLNSQRWPKGTYQIGRLWWGWFGPLSIWTALLTNMLFTLVLMSAVLALGVAMGDWRIGYWGALLTALCPPLVAGSFYFSLDYPLVAMTTGGLLLLFHTRGLTAPWLSALFAAWCALSLCVKPSYPLYLIVPGLWVLMRGIWPRGTTGEPNRSGWLRVAGNLLLLVAVAFPLTIWLYQPDFRQLITEISHHLFSPPPGLEDQFPAAGIKPWTVEWLLAVPGFALMNHPWPLLLLALPGLVLLHRPKHPLPLRGLLLSCIWGGYLILTLMANKLERYIHPIYPLLCLLTVWGAMRLIPRRWQTLGLAGLVAVYGVVLGIAHINPPPWGQRQLSFTPRAPYNDLRLPSSAQLAGLRRNTYHPNCDLVTLVKGIRELSEADGSRRPLGVSYRHAHELADQLPMDFERMAVFAAQVVRNRFVLPLELERDQLPPSVVVVHSPDEKPQSFCPRARTTAQRKVQIVCDRTIELGVSLLRPIRPGTPCR